MYIHLYKMIYLLPIPKQVLSTLTYSFDLLTRYEKVEGKEKSVKLPSIITYIMKQGLTRGRYGIYK